MKAPVSEWFETFFDSIANDLWEAAMPTEATDAEVAFVRKVLDLSTGNAVLDVPCGRGRHALALAGAGMRVVGVDISEDAIGVLRDRAAAADLEIDARVGDMRELDIGLVDGAYSFGNSVGYFGPEGIGRFFSAVAPSLGTGGRFVVDSFMVAECILAHLELESVYEAGGIRMSDVNRYDPFDSRLDTTVTFEWDGGKSSREMSHWVLTSGEIVRSLTSAGFEVEALYGDTDGGPFAVGSSRMLAVARRVAT